MNNIDINSIIPSSSIFFDFDKTDTEGGMQTKDKMVWINEKPRDIEVLDKFLRSKFKLNFNSKYVYSLFLPPTGKDKTLTLPKPNQKFTHRVVISSITESPSISIGPRSHKLQFKANEAYLLTKPFSTMIELSFDNSPRLIIPAKKGFREKRITKKIDKRFIIVLDYYDGGETIEDDSK